MANRSGNDRGQSWVEMADSTRHIAKVTTDEGNTTAEVVHNRNYVWNSGTGLWEKMTQPGGGGGGGGDGAILDGVSASIKATVKDYTNSNPLTVVLTDTNGDAYTAGAAPGGLTDTQLRASPVPVSGSGVFHVDDNGGSLTVDGTFWQATQPVSGTVAVSNFPATQPVSGTVSVSGAVDTELPAAIALADNMANPTVPQVGAHALVWDSAGGNWDRILQPLTDTQLRATPVPISGTVTANAGSGPWPVTDNGGSLTVDAPVGTPVFTRLSDGAAAYNTNTGAQLPSALVGGRLDVNTGAWLGSTAPTVGSKTSANSVPVVIASDQGTVPVDVTPSSPAANDYLPVRLTDGTLFNFNQPTYLLYQTPRVTTAAATDFFDLFNASGSGKKLRIMGIYPVNQVTAASAIVPSWQFSVIKTSAVGTGGTAHTFEGAAAPGAGALNITRADGTDASLPAQITSRSLPTGGATASKFMFDIWQTSEETNPAVYMTQMFNWIPTGDAIKEVILAEGEGMKIRQITATASTGTNFGFLVVFTLV